MSDHEWRQVRVTFRKAVSDGNYGTESAEVTLEWFLDHEEKASSHHDLSAASTMLSQARAIVHAELERSPSQRVRSAIDHSTYTGVFSKAEADAAFSSMAGPDDDGEE